MIHDARPGAGRLERDARGVPATATRSSSATRTSRARERDGFQIFNPGSPTDRRRAPPTRWASRAIADGEVAFELIALS